MTAGGVKGEVRIEEADRAERTIARRSAESRATVPDLELSVNAQISHSPDDPHTVTAILARACAHALREVPRANAAYRDGHFELYSRINIGVIVAEDDVHTIPTVFDCDQKSIQELSEEISKLAERATSAELSPPELGGATFTLWNAGPLGLDRATPLIVPPQAAALAAGAPSNGLIVLTLACDHRILYGARAARFLTLIRAMLSQGVS